MTRKLLSILAAAVLAVPTAAAAQTSALVSLEDRRVFDADILSRSLRDADPAVRSRAALAAARIRDPAAVPLLIPLLTDPDSGAAATAAFALGQIGDTTAVAALAPMLDPARLRSTPSVIAEAAEALGKLRTAAARGALERFLASAPGSGRGVREGVGAALLAVWRFPRPADSQPIIAWLSSPDTALDWRAAYALSRRPDPAGTAALAARTTHPHPLVRAYAVRALTASLADSAGIERERAIELVLEATRDPDQGVSVNAVRVLGTYDAPAAVAALRGLLASRDPYLVISAAESLARLGSSASVAAGDLAALAADPAREVALRTAALAALVEVAPASAAALLDELSASPAWRMRAAAGAAAGTLRDRARVEAAVRDPDARVAATALDAAVTALGDSVGTLRHLLTAALGHPDPIVRTNALGAFGRVADPSDLPLLLDAYQRALGDTLLNDAALASLAALGRISERTQGVAARAFFTRFTRSRDYLVRRAAAAAFGDSTARAAWGDPLPIEGALTPAAARSAMNALPDRARIVTSRGIIDLDLFAAEAPLTVRNFAALARRGFFDGQEWPRVVPNFVIQGGDPRGDTSGGPGYAIRDEINRRPYLTGTLGMALSGPDTGGSQWFITHSPQPHLDGTYTVFGRVTGGMDVVNRILPGDRIERIEIIQ